MSRLYANSTPFYIRDLSIGNFGTLFGAGWVDVLEPIPQGPEGVL